jgi:UDP-glucose 4-epimerase
LTKLNVAVIGANGFIGKHLTRSLMLNANLNIHLFGRNDCNEFKNELPYYKFDLNDINQIHNYFKKIEIVYYLASGTIPSSSWNYPNIEIENNLLPFINFLNLLTEYKLKKVILVSSAGTIYGPSNEKLTEESNKIPFSPYGITKLCMENFLRYFEIKEKIKYDIFRVSNVYGPGQDISKGLGIINTFLEKIISDQKITVYGNGSNTRNYVNVQDVAKILSFSVNSLNKSNIYNLASDDNISINQLIKLIQEVISDDFKIIYENIRQSDNPSISLDNGKLKNDFKDFEFINLKNGIKQTYSYIKRSFKSN